MMTTKKNANNFCSQLFNSWIRVDTAYLQEKKQIKTEKTEAKK